MRSSLFLDVTQRNNPEERRSGYSYGKDIRAESNILFQSNTH